MLEVGPVFPARRDPKHSQPHGGRKKRTVDGGWDFNTYRMRTEDKGRQDNG